MGRVENQDKLESSQETEVQGESKSTQKDETEADTG